ncbi:MAG: CPBP family intramembrane metalloprotease, partial [Pyrinomonadaceae bacterium]|nr:CPBP family intramembrane metalloprotease [Pyrinomonadaceae bacterium]
MRIDLFFNQAGRLRSGWRFAIFSVAMLLALMLLGNGLSFVLASALGSVERATAFLDSDWGFVAQALMLLVPALVIGWICCFAFEDLPFCALGWATHRGWLRDVWTGAVFGAGSMLLAVLFAALFGGFHFSVSSSNLFYGVARTLLVSALIFALAAAAEEALFRGYPLQTMLRSLPAWVALIPSSILFAVVHLDNPNVARGFTFLNTMLAGLWLAVGFLRTRSLWFPLGLH